MCARVLFKSFSGYDAVFGLSEQGHHLQYLTPDYRFDFVIFDPEVGQNKLELSSAKLNSLVVR